MRKILTGAKIINCVNPQPLEGHDIVIEGDHIQSIQKKPDQNLGNGEIINLSGKTILPGLINMHVHLIADDKKKLMSDVISKSDEQLLLQAVKNSFLSLKSGVTTLRDCGSRNNLVNWLRDAIYQGTLAGPRIVSSGMLMTITGGHGYYIGLEADGVDGVIKAVRSLIKNGSDFIKIMVTGGGNTPTTDKRIPSYTDSELYAAVEEAHRFGKKVAVHAHGTMGIKQSLEAGVDTIEHCSFIADDGSRKADWDILKEIKKKNISIVPTVSSGIRLAFQGPFTVESFDKSVKKNLDYFHKRWDLFKDQYQSGVIVLAGNDAGTMGTPHDDFMVHLEMMAALGMENREVIDSATCKAAKALGLESEIGTIEEGKKADLLVVEGNPLQDIHSLRNPYLVMVGGKKVMSSDENAIN